MTVLSAQTMGAAVPLRAEHRLRARLARIPTIELTNQTAHGIHVLAGMPTAQLIFELVDKRSSVAIPHLVDQLPSTPDVPSR